MPAHYLTSAAARTLSVESVARFSDDEAWEEFKRVRWDDNGGEPYCPRKGCGCRTVYAYRARRIWKCKQCDHQFSVTSGTIFASRKLPHRKYLMVCAYMANSSKGINAIMLAGYIGVSVKTAHVILHKARRALAAEVRELKLNGVVEADGAYFGGYVKPRNLRQYRHDRRLRSNRSGKRLSMVVMREREGRTLPMVFPQEDAGAKAIRPRVGAGSTIHADSAKHWDVLHAHYPVMRVNHREAFEQDGACTNLAESFFSRARRSEIGVHHHISGPHLEAYAMELAWLEDHRRLDNGAKCRAIFSACLKHPVCELWKGYWQGAASRRPPTVYSEAVKAAKSRRARRPRKPDQQSQGEAKHHADKKAMPRIVLGKLREQTTLLTLRDLAYEFMSQRDLDRGDLPLAGRVVKRVSRFLKHQCLLGIIRPRRVGRTEGWEIVR